MHDFADQYQRSPNYRPGGKRYWGREFKWVKLMNEPIYDLQTGESAMANLLHLFLPLLLFRRTVGNLVIFLCCAIGGLELAVLVLIMRM
jgi:hypothetical protein